MPRAVAFRADADAEIGSGHVMRCFGLAEYLAGRGFACRLLTTAPAAPAVQRWREAGLDDAAIEGARGTPADATATAAAVRAMAADWLVLDGYDFTPDYRRRLGPAAHRLAFDDFADPGDGADIVVNQNAGAERRVAGGAGARLLLGCDYAVLRRAVREAAIAPKRPAPTILITLGGYGRAEPIRAIVAALAERAVEAEIEAVGVEGRAGVPRVRWHAPQELAPLMARADLAICAGGTTSLELAHLGVPMIIVVAADNQRAGAAALAASGAAEIAGEGADALPAAAALAARLAVQPERRAEMSRRGRALVDGHGVARILAAMRDVEARPQARRA